MIATVDALLHLEQTAAGAELQVEVRSATPQDLTWRLEVDAKTSGGSSRVSQGGAASGTEPQPLARVRVGGAPSGRAELVVRDSSGAVLIQRVCTLAGDAQARCE